MGIVKIAEAQIVSSILSYLGIRENMGEGLYWRNQTGSFRGEHESKDGTKKRWFAKTGKKGSADIIGLRPPNGRLVAIEVKRPGQKQSDDQKAFQEKIEKMGGDYVLVYSLQDVLDHGL